MSSNACAIIKKVKESFPRKKGLGLRARGVDYSHLDQLIAGLQDLVVASQVMMWFVMMMDGPLRATYPHCTAHRLLVCRTWWWPPK
jgi:hypothetical protein